MIFFIRYSSELNLILMMLLLLASFGYSLGFGKNIKQLETYDQIWLILIIITHFFSSSLLPFHIFVFLCQMFCACLLRLLMSKFLQFSNIFIIIATIFFQYICMLMNRVVVRGRIFRWAQDCLGWFRSFHKPPLICLGQFPGF